MSTTPSPLTITPLRVGDLLVGEEERLPVFVHVIDHPQGRILVDTGLTRTHPAVADMDPRLTTLDTLDVDLDGITAVVNTHLHFDHCGGNHLFPGRPVYVQRQELDDARTKEDYTIPEWVDAPGIDYSPVDGEHELLPGVRLLPAPGHTDGSQVVVVDTVDGRVVIAGDTAVWAGQLDDPETEGQRLIRSLTPREVWLSHADEPWTPSRD
ncbi:MAG: N-acyl homoserine lactonase family protein [Microbacterium sp.]|uniref:N-acyl homoserine lactonase family protein n=1 Tax=Microbacterium sp. TaxID=51671 RepID=UPI001AD453FC|nr:N-acyl homoserine lactonase family protein [Microbacterium sp.]MBN9153536.1 N-acyl homoserine lactonase family protein [Microbacterium sp.]MBN9175738.1 N-acyl homoserine lactonase family protein [Microbacterium sp.]